MSAGGIKQFKPGSSAGGGGDFPFNGNRTISRQIPGLVGVNLGTTTAKAFLEKLAFISLPPAVSLAGFFRLNGGASFVPFGTIERGTLVNEVKLILTGSISPNSPFIKELVVGGGALPANHPVSPPSANPVRQSLYSGVFTLNTPQVFTSRAIDTNDVLSAQATATWNYGVPAYYGKGTAVGAAIDETFIKSLNKTALNQTLPSVAATPGPEEFIYYVAPVSAGIKVFEFLSADQTNPESALRVKVRTNAEIANGVPVADATEYFVVRSLSAGLGGGSPYTFQIGNPG